MKALILAPYPFNQAPSQRFRFEMMLPYLKEHGVDYDFVPFLTRKGWSILYTEGNSWQKLWAIISGFGRRKLWMLKAHKYDLVFIHREAAPLGPPVFEWWLAKVLGKKIIFDFDDAIWLPNTSEENSMAAALKWHSKTKSICRWARKVSAGNDYLANYARPYCERVVVLPTVVNTEVHQPSSKKRLTSKGHIEVQEEKPVIGWTGSHSTLPYLQEIVPVLQRLQEDIDFEFLVIANRDPKLPLKNYRFMKWQSHTEIEDLQRLDIGIMPLPDNLWSQGKCGFKLIQYLAMGIPAVASPVGVNRNVLTHEVSGFFADSPDEWITYLKHLVSSKATRLSMGEKGRKHIEKHFSLSAQKATFLALFHS